MFNTMKTFLTFCKNFNILSKKLTYYSYILHILSKLCNLVQSMFGCEE